MGNIYVKLYGIWTHGSKGDVVYTHFLSRALCNHLCNLVEDIMRNNSVKLF